MAFDYSKLKGLARQKGETLETIEKKTGIKSQTMSMKWNGRSHFTDVEIYALKVLLDIDDVDEYFFTPKL